MNEIAKYTPPVIECDFESMQERLDKELEPYKGYSEEQIAVMDEEAVKVSAKALRGMFKDIDESRKEIKRKYNEPLNRFEAGVKGITEQINATLSLFSSVEKRNEEARKEERRATFEEDWKGAVGDLAELVPYSVIEDTKWLNKTTTTKKAEDELFAKITKVLEDRRTLSSLCLPHAEACDALYCRTLDLQKAIDEDKRLTEAEAEAAARARRAMEIDRQAQKRHESAPTQENPQTPVSEPVKTWELKFSGTHSHAVLIAKYVSTVGAQGIGAIKAVAE
jgi:hypothetical protein